MVRALAVATFGLALAASAAPSDRPNVVLVLGDDHGWPYYGFQASPQVLTNGQNVQEVVQTPNLDALAASGVVFRRGYATASLCAPSLQTLLSAHGHEWSQWLRLADEVRRVVPLSSLERAERRENRYADNLPRALGRQGYRTWEGGKLWAGLATDAGFEQGLATYVEPGPFFLSGGSGFGRDGWTVEACGSTASTTSPCPALAPLRDFLEEVGDEPFFVWFAPELPHVPWDAPDEYREPLAALGLAKYEIDHLSNVRWFDELLGELLRELDARGLRENTLIVYASDNGWGLGFQSFAGSGRGKGTLYDLGFRTPVIFNQPGVVSAGAVYDDLVSLSDLPATILDIVGARIPPGSMGMSLRDRIAGGRPLERSGLVTFSEGDGGAWVDDQWRYLHFDDGHEELYRIDLDPFELTDLAAQHPEKLDEYRPLVDARRAALAAPPDVVEVVGQVQGLDGAPIAGGRMALEGGPYPLFALTGTRGWFRFAAVDASSHLKLHQSRGLRSSLRDPATGTSFVYPFTSPGLFVPLAGAERHPVQGPLGGSVVGHVLSAVATPVVGAKVQLSARLPETDVALTTVTQGDGSFEFTNLPAAPGYRLRVRGRGYLPERVEDLEVGSPDTRVEVDVVLPSR